MENKPDYSQELPDEILMMIFSYLEITDAIRVFNTDERFARIMCDTKLKCMDINRRPLTITHNIQVLYKTTRVLFNQMPESPLIRKMLPFVLRNRIVEASGLHLSKYPSIIDAQELIISLKSFKSIPDILGLVGRLIINSCDDLIHVGKLETTESMTMTSGAQNLISISDQPNLRDLTINRCPKMSDFSNVHSLRRLHISKCDASKLLKLPPNLVELSLYDTKISKLVIPDSLKSLKISECPRLSAIVPENDNVNLDMLSIDSCPKLVDLLGILRNIRTLEWANNKFQKIFIHNLISSNLLDNLESLTIYRPNMEEINAIKTLKNLKLLKILGSCAATALSGISNLDKLTIKNVPNLHKLTNLVNVKHVVLENCDKLITLDNWVGVDTVFISVCDAIQNYSVLSQVEDIRIEFNRGNQIADFRSLWVRDKPIKKLVIRSNASNHGAHKKLKANLIARWGPDLVEWCGPKENYYNIFQ